MSHPRSIIRNSITNRLKSKIDDAYLTDAEDRVFSSRTKPLFDQFLPAILVYARDENVSSEGIDGNAALKRELELAIEAVLLGGEQIDQDLDDIANQIESALDGFVIADRGNDLLRLKSTEIDSSVEGSKIYGAVRLTYLVTYLTAIKQDDAEGPIITDIVSNL